jgi:hypothetical protein
MGGKLLVVPAGTRQPTGRLTTIRESYPGRLGSRTATMVDCVCDCGTPRTTSAHRFLTENTKSCGCLWSEGPGVTAAAAGHDQGPTNHRQPARYGPALLLQQGLMCPWPLCLQPLYLPVSVDHDHRHCSTTGCCAYCPRGVVHHACNTRISVIELYRARLGLPNSVVAYLDSTPRKDPVGYAIKLADYSGGWAARYGVPESKN